MALCLKCLAEGVVSGGGLMPEDGIYRLKLTFVPDEGAEIDGERSIRFAGAVVDGADESGFAATGELSGNFGPDADDDRSAPATVSAFARNGATAFVLLEVDRESGGGHAFVANLAARSSDDGEVSLEGYAFMGWRDAAEG